MIKKILKQIEQTQAETERLLDRYLYLQREAYDKGSDEECAYWTERVCDLNEILSCLRDDVWNLKGES